MTSEATEAIPEVIGAYTIVRTLGRGAMGTVYEARDDGGTAVALKVMHAHLDADPTARERLRREVTALQRLQHPAVARVLDFELDGAEAFIVTELVDGRTLEAEIDEGGPLDAVDLAELAQQLANALEAVHLAGVVHRDLKPSNVMISSRGPVLIDFGIAQSASPDVEVEPGLTKHGFVIGTPGYLAPELVDGAAATPDSDWWSWAALLAFAGTGRAPFGVRPVDVVLRRSREGRADLVGLPARSARALAASLQSQAAVRWRQAMVIRALGRDADAATFAAATGATATTNATPGTTELPPDAAMATPTQATGPQPLTWIPPGVPPTAMVATATGPIPMGEARYQPYAAVAASTEAEPEEIAQAEALAAAKTITRPKLPRRVVTVLGCLVPLTVLAATRPGAAVVALAAVVVVCRIVGHGWQAMWDRREKFGAPRSSDAAVAVAKAPLHVALGVATAVPQLLVAALVGVGAWLGGRWLFLDQAVSTDVADVADVVDSVAVVAAPGLRYSIVLAAAFVAMAMVAWFGPASKTARIGARRILKSVAPGAITTAVLIAACLIGGWLLARPLIGEAPEIHWSPLPNPLESVAEVDDVDANANVDDAPEEPEEEGNQ